MRSRKILTLQVPTLHNGQTHSNNLLAIADELLECVWPFCGIGALRVEANIEDLGRKETYFTLGLS